MRGKPAAGQGIMGTKQDEKPPQGPRQQDWERVSAMAGLDSEGGILPPPPGAGIDRTPSPFWRNRFAN